MARLSWSADGERYFEGGVDRGVLYVDDGPGVAWSGLVSVAESPSGVTVEPYYIDGVKYLNRLTREEFEATITAYTYPEEFGKCDGTLAVGNGLFARQQRRRPFGFSYRTKVGNDTDGTDHAYKIHVVYGASAEPSSVSYQTLGGAQDALNFSWHVTTKASLVKNFAPSAHFVIDSRETPGALLGAIEDILYGTPQATPRLPSAGELAFLFTSFNNTNFDAGGPLDISYYVYDAGTPSSVNTEIFDGGAP
jgi:hypothetical protein